MTVNHGVLGSSPRLGAIFFGPLEKRLNSHAFHACIHGFESRTGHHLIRRHPLSDVFFIAFFLNKEFYGVETSMKTSVKT